MDVKSDKPVEWVELLDPKSQQIIYVNLASGECSWDPPHNEMIKPRSSDQWWELFDVKAQRNYYYNCSTYETVWQKPEAGDIVPLASLQLSNKNPHTSDLAQAKKIQFRNRCGPQNSAVTANDGPTQCRSFSTEVHLTRDQRSSLLSQPTEPSNHQRVRDWLRNANAIASDEEHRAACFSDRPIRRMAQLNSSAHVAPSTCASTDVSSLSHLLTASTYKVGSHAGYAANPDQPERTDSVPLSKTAAQLTTTVHSSIPIFRQSENLNHDSYRASPPPTSNASCAAAFPKKLADTNPSPLPDFGNQQTGFNLPAKHNRMFSCSTPDAFLQRQRLFPRTNPTAYRSFDEAKGSRMSQLTNLSRVDSQPSHHQPIRSSMYSQHSKGPFVRTSVNNAFPPPVVFPMMQQLQHSGLVDNRDTANSSVGPDKSFSYLSDHSTLPVLSTLSFNSSNLSSLSSSLDSSEVSVANTSSEKLDDLVTETLGVPADSSRDKDESIDHTWAMDATSKMARSLYISDSKAVTGDPFYSDDPEQPPVPPPRSASAFGSHRIAQSVHLSEPGNAANQDFLLVPVKLVDAGDRLRDTSPDSRCTMFEAKRVSNYSPLQRDHLRLQDVPSYDSSHFDRIFHSFLSEGTTKKGTEPESSSSDYHHSVAPETVPSVNLSSPSHYVTREITNDFSTGNEFTCVRLTSTGTTWTQLSTATSVNKTDDRVTADAADCTGEDSPLLDSARRFGVLQRSSSGGFINASDSHRNVYLPLPGSKQLTRPFYTLIYPGHPAFARFTAPFDWPKQLFKPEQDVGTLMSWTKGKFSKRILVSTDASLKKQVADIFKLVQLFMGDHKARLNLPEYGAIIIHRALNSVAIRDELFAQLCKQTTCNPNTRSLNSGWVLLCVCLYYFPPNNQLFRDALNAYLVSRATIAVDTSMMNTKDFIRRIDQSGADSTTAVSSGRCSSLVDFKENYKHDGVSEVSEEQPRFPVTPMIYPVDLTFGTCARPTAAHFARVAPRLFVRSLNVGSRKFTDPPSLDEIYHVKNFILKPCVFGGSLEEIMRIQSSRFPHLKLPWIQLFLTEEILRMNGALTEGIFRLSPDLDLVTEIRCQFEKLLEIFRMVCDSNATVPTVRTPGSSSEERFLILRPPPASWLLSTTHENSPTDPGVTTVRSPSASSLPGATYLTGEFSWPLIPASLPSSPMEFILMTPTAQWPLSLREMANRSAGAHSDKQVDAHLAAGLLKLWLRELSDPLIPCWLQSACLNAAMNAEAVEPCGEPIGDNSSGCPLNRFNACCRIVRRIPFLARRSLLYLIMLLQHLAKLEHSSVSLMDPRNLATVIAPNLMRSNTTDPHELLANVRSQTAFVRILITHLNIDEEIRVLEAEESHPSSLCS